MTLYNQNGHEEPHDLRLLDHRRDVLIYESDPLEEGVEATGVPVMTLFASSSAPDTDFIVKLVDVHPDGFAQSLCYGIVRARFRNGLDSPELMTPGEPYEFVIELLPTNNPSRGTRFAWTYPAATSQTSIAPTTWARKTGPIHSCRWPTKQSSTTLSDHPESRCRWSWVEDFQTLSRGGCAPH